jgi:hypothetical protein
MIKLAKTGGLSIGLSKDGPALNYKKGNLSVGAVKEKKGPSFGFTFSKKF